MSVKEKSVDDEIIDVDAIASTNNNDEYVDGDVNLDKRIEMVEDEPETLEDFIEKAMARQQKTVNTALKSINKRVNEHDKRISKVEQQQEEIMKALSLNSKTSKAIDEDGNADDNRNVFDKTLGAVGGVMHGIVDTTAFILESAVDLVTLGRAKRDY